MARPIRRRRDRGAVRQLPSGRWQASIWSPAKKKRVSLGTFPTRDDADAAIGAQRTDESRGEWIDPELGRETFAAYATDWITSHPRLGRGTRALYRSHLKTHLSPAFGATPLKDIKPATVRHWYGSTDASPSTRAKSYRLLRAILNGAIEDEFILRNPCTIKGGGEEPRRERPMVSVHQLLGIADAAEPRFRAAFLMAAFASLRNAELCGLQRHMEEFCPDDPEAWVFTKRDGSPLDRHYLNR